MMKIKCDMEVTKNTSQKHENLATRTIGDDPDVIGLLQGGIKSFAHISWTLYFS